MSDHVKNGRALLVWSLPSLIASAALANVYAKHATLTLSIVMQKLGWLSVLMIALSVAAQLLDDRLDDTWPCLSAFAFAVGGVACITMLGNLAVGMTFSGMRSLFLAAALVSAPCILALAIFSYVIAEMTRLGFANVFISLAVQIVLLIALILDARPLPTYAAVIVSFAAFVVGLARTMRRRRTSST